MGLWNTLKTALVDTGETSPDGAVSPDDIEKELAELRRASSSGATSEDSTTRGPDPTPVPVVTDIVEGVPFQDIYSNAKVPTAQYTAEQLITVVNKLQAKSVSKEQVISTIGAMDEADDRWTLGDVLNDSNLKRNAIQGYLTGMGASMKSVEDRTNALITNVDTKFGELTTEIRNQIAELEKALAEAKAESDGEKAEATKTLQATREAYTRETSRLNAEFERLAYLQTILK